MPRVSVIIPTFNREHYIVKAIDTVLRQHYQDFEIIVVDDGSTDNTRTVLERYGSRITYVYQENAGVSAARNAGIMRASGEWICFLDSDDEWLPDYLAVQISNVEEYPRAVAHFTNSVMVLPNGTRSDHFAGINLLKQFGTKKCLMVEKPFSLILDHAHWFLQPCIMRQDVLLENGLFDRCLTIAEDLDVILGMALRGPFSLCRDVLVEIWRREEEIDNLASQRVKSGIYAHHAFGQVYRRRLKLPGLSGAERKSLVRAYSLNRRSFANILLRTGRIRRARALYEKSFYLYPSVRSFVKYLATFLPFKCPMLFVWRGRHILPGAAEPGKTAGKQE